MELMSVLSLIINVFAFVVLVLMIIGAVTILLITSGCSNFGIKRKIRSLMASCFGKSDMAASKTHVDLQPYRSKLASVVGMYFRLPSSGPSQILDHLYIGSENNATNLRMLRDIGITHIINTVESYVKTGPSYYGKKVRYMGFAAEDDEEYDIMQHHDDVYAFIEDARKRGGKAFIHCVMGINRSGALAISYLMVHKHMGPLSATKAAKRARQVILTNNRFQYQVLAFAKKRGLLTLDKDEL